MKEIVQKTDYIEQEDTTLLDISKDTQVKKTRKESISVEKEHAKPWTEEKITLKKAKPEKKEISKETFETVQLKPSSRKGRYRKIESRRDRFETYS